MIKKYIDYELNETDYFIWCILNQLNSEDKKINHYKGQFIKLLENKMFNNINSKRIKDIKLIIRIYN